MKRKERVLVLIAIMAAVAIATAGIVISVLYNTAVDVERRRLAVNAKTEARWIESAMRFELEEHQGDRRVAEREALTLFIDVHRRFQTFGKTRETVLARRDGDQIAFLMRQGTGSPEANDRLPFDGRLAQPMYRALQGLSGTMIGLDHAGQRVVAAYEPVAALNMGIVTKVNLAEVRTPFVRAGLLAAGVSFGLVAVGAWLLLAISRPMIRDLEASEARYRAIVQQQSEFLARFLPDGTLTFVNEALCRYSGRGSAELIGQNLWHILSDEACRKYQARLETLTPERPTGEDEISWAAPDGTTRWVNLVSTALFDDRGAVAEYQSVGRDATDRHEREVALARALAEKEILLKEIHHRVKNNMAVISSLLGLQERGIEDANARAVFEAMRARIKTMSLVHELLYQVGDFKHIRLDSYLDKVARILVQSQDDASGRVLLHRDMANVTLELERAIPCGLILTELVSNALKHAFPAGRSGSVRVNLHETQSGEIELRVEDDGVGMEVGERTGFGLQLVELMVRQLDGTIEHRIGDGRRVAVRFPVRPV